MAGHRVLIIDDEELIRLVLSDYLTECGYDTSTAMDGEIGLHKANNEPFDVVLCDLRMPRMDGIEVITSLSAVKPELPIIVVSGTGVLTDAVDAIRRGAWDYVSKPILDMKEIVAVIERVIGRARLVRERNEYQYQIESFNAKLEAEVNRQTASLQIQNRKLTMLNRISRTISHSLELDTMLNSSLVAAKEAMSADAGMIRLISPVTGKLQIAGYTGFDEVPDPSRELGTLPDDISSSVALDGSVKYGPLPEDDPWARYLIAQGYRSFICIPLRSGQDYIASQEQGDNVVLGVMGVFSFAEKAFDVDNIELMMTIGNQVGIAIARAQYAADLWKANIKLEQALIEMRRLDSLREQFIQNVAHELRTPLALVRGYIEMLATGELSPEETQSAVAVAKKRVLALVELVEAITTLQDLDSTPLNIQNVNVRDLLNTSIRMAGQRAQLAGVQLELEPVGDGLDIISGDFIRLAQALHQLLDNACKFSPDGGDVVMGSKLSEDGAYAIITVSDPGIGIPEEEFEHIFGRFYQVDGTAKRRYGGTGLGLALVKQIVETHHGSVMVESVVDQGSTFTLKLPVNFSPSL